MRQNFVVCRHVSDKSGSAVGEKRLWNTGADDRIPLKWVLKKFEDIVLLGL
jgi:hypothetical protein